MKSVLRIPQPLTLTGLLFLLLCVAAPASAQNVPFHRLTFDFGGGWTPTVGATSNALSDGWNVTGGVGFNFARSFGVEGQVLYAGLGVTNGVIHEFGVPGANAHIWGFTLDPIIRFHPRGRVGFYLIGGPGYYRRVVNFTQPTLVSTLVFDPFFGIISPVVYSANQTIGTVTRVGWGANGGGGLTFRLGQGDTKLFLEARYHYISTQSESTRIIPVTLGIRW